MKDTFEFNGEKYKKASKHQKEWGNRLMEDLQLHGNELILDLGCGDGVLTEHLAEFVPEGKVLGIDASIGMIETAEKLTRENLKFMQMDINQMNFQSEFDVIFSNAALHWVKDHELLLNHAFSALKKGGVILWNFGSAGNCANFIEAVREVTAKEKYQDYFCDFEWPWYMPSRAEYEKMIEIVGFSKASVIEENADRYFGNADEIIGWIDQPCIVPFIGCVPDDKKGEFRSAVIESVLERTRQPDGRCFETFRRLKVFAVK